LIDYEIYVLIIILTKKKYIVKNIKKLSHRKKIPFTRQDILAIRMRLLLISGSVETTF